jgi:predicted GTPase
MNPITITEISDELLATCRRLEQGARVDGSVASVTRLLGRIGTRLARPPRIALLGEFNTGKSTIANALLGAGVVPTSIHANTRVPLLLHFAEVPTLEVELADRTRRPMSVAEVGALQRGEARLLHVGLPVARLKKFELIDTPGLATGQGRIDELSLDACSRSHLAIWCTMAPQAWKASERAVWTSVPQRLHERGILAVTHKDAMREDRDWERLSARLTAEARPYFRSLAVIAAADAQRALAIEDAAARAEAWRQSGGAGLEASVLEAVASQLALRYGAAERLIDRATKRLCSGIAAPSPLLAA